MSKLPTELAATGPLAMQTRSLVKRFGRTTALAGVDLTVPGGSVYVLVGPNGAGKSTTLKVLLDLVVTDSGTAEVLGLDTHANGPHVRAQIGYVPEREDTVYGWMRVGALLRYHAGYYAGWDAAYASELSKLFEVRPEMRFDKLSKGQQRRVQLLLALAQRPPVLVMDEPTDGLDPVMREQVLSALAAHLARFQTTILVSTHLVHETERLGDHLGVMVGGRIQLQCTRETLRRQLRRYRIQVPDGWRGAPALDDVVIRRDGSLREFAWSIWGDEAEVSERLRGTGATILQVDPLTLEDAALALLGRQTAAESEGMVAIPVGV
jgi:ABC-2 type transport system ATP-binding protein